MSVITFGPPPVVDEDEEDVFQDAALEIVQFDVIKAGSPTAMLLSIFSDKEISIGPEARNAEPPKLPIEDFTKGLALILDASASDAAAHLDVANSDDPVTLGAPLKEYAKEWLFDTAFQLSTSFLTPELFKKYAPFLGLGKWMIHPMNAFYTTLKYAQTDNPCETFVNMSIIWAALYSGSYAINTVMAKTVMAALNHWEHELAGVGSAIRGVTTHCTPFDSSTGVYSPFKNLFQRSDYALGKVNGVTNRCAIATKSRDRVMEWAIDTIRSVAELAEAGLKTIARPIVGEKISTMSIPSNVVKSLRGHFCETFLLKEKGLTDRELSGYQNK